MVVYSAGKVLFTKRKHRQRKDRFTTIKMHVDAICAFAWMRRYAASRLVFLIRIHFEGQLSYMDAIMWIILRS